MYPFFFILAYFWDYYYHDSKFDKQAFVLVDYDIQVYPWADQDVAAFEAH